MHKKVYEFFVTGMQSPIYVAKQVSVIWITLSQYCFYLQLGTASRAAVARHLHTKTRTARRVVAAIHTRKAKTPFTCNHRPDTFKARFLTELLWAASLLASLHSPLLSAIKEDLGLPSGYMLDIRADAWEAFIQYF
jgi:hypothetical protein